MTSLLTALNSFCFTSASATPDKASEAGEVEFQIVFAASAVLLAGGVAACLVALAQAF
jgi:hypothetical protein